MRDVEEVEAADLIVRLLRYYESNIRRELMRAIISADAKDAEKLATLVEEWGLKQVDSVVEIIIGIFQFYREFVSPAVEFLACATP